MRKPTDTARPEAKRTKGANVAPPTRPVGQMLDSIPSLAGLLGGHRRAQASFAQVRRLLPQTLATQVRAGPIEGNVWTLLAANGGAAAKLRQALPTLLADLAATEPGITEIKIKVLAPTLPG